MSVRLFGLVHLYLYVRDPDKDRILIMYVTVLRLQNHLQGERLVQYCIRGITMGITLFSKFTTSSVPTHFFSTRVSVITGLMNDTVFLVSF